MICIQNVYLKRKKMNIKILNINLLIKRVKYFQIYNNFQNFSEHNFIFLQVSHPDCLNTEEVVSLFNFLQRKDLDFAQLHKFKFLPLLILAEYFDIKLIHTFLSRKLTSYPLYKLPSLFSQIFSIQHLLSKETFHSLLRDFNLKLPLLLISKSTYLYVRSVIRHTIFLSENFPKRCKFCHLQNSKSLKTETVSFEWVRNIHLCEECVSLLNFKI